MPSSSADAKKNQTLGKYPVVFLENTATHLDSVASFQRHVF